MLHLAALLQAGNLLLWNSELPQAILGGMQQPVAFLHGHPMSILRERALILPGQQVFLLAAHNVRTVHGKEAISFADILISGVRGDILNPSCKARLHIREPMFINVHVPRDT